MGFAWSYSALNSFETCGFKHQQCNILKRFRDESPALKAGNQTHKIFENALKFSVALPEGYEKYQYLIDETRSGPGELLVEQQYAITKEFEPCEYFGSKAWYRVKIDAMKIIPNEYVAKVRDWKTGKQKDDYCQLMLQAATVFIYFPNVHRILTEFHWLDHWNGDRCLYTPAAFNRRDMPTSWTGVLDRVKQMELAAATGNYLKKPSGLCRAHCPVVDCEYNGRKK